MIREDILRKSFLLSFGAVVLMLLMTLTSSAQSMSEDYYLTKSLSTANGLPYHSVTGLFQDDKGFIWISTFGGGLSRYDGDALVTFSATTQQALKTNYLTQCCQDNLDRLWIAGAKGIDLMDMRTLTLCDVPENVSGSYKDTYVPNVVRASDGGIWYNAANNIYRVSVSDGDMVLDSIVVSSNTNVRIQLSVVENDGSVYYSLDGALYRAQYVKSRGMVATRVFPDVSIGEENKATAFLKAQEMLWVGTMDGLYRIDTSSGAATVFHHDDADRRSLAHDEVSSLALTSYSEIVVGTLGGLNIYDMQTDSFVRYGSQVSSRTVMIPGDLVRSLKVFGNQIWVGLERDGLAVLRRRTLPVRNYSHVAGNPNSIPDVAVSSLFIDSQGRHWTGMTETGLYFFDGRRNSRFFNKSNSALFHNTVSAVAEDGKGTIWLGTVDGHINTVGKDLVVLRPSFSASAVAKTIDYITNFVYDDMNDRMWILSRTGAFIYDFKKDTLTPYDEPMFLCLGGIIDQYGYLWIGYRDGMKHINLTTGKSDDWQEIKLGASFAIDQLGYLWVGTFDNGLYQVVSGPSDPLNFIRFDMKSGIADDRIRGIVSTEGYIWASTENGLSRLDVATGEVESFSAADGLLSANFCDDCIAIDGQGVIYLGHREGLSVLSSSYVRQSVDELSKLVITRGFGRRTSFNLAYDDSFTVNEKDRFVAFSFSDFTYSQNSNVTYSTRIYPRDEEWREVYGNAKYVRYGAIRGGHYKIQVRATDARGNVLSEDERDLYVKPLFYKTWWFIMAMLLLAAFLVFHVIRFRTRAIERQKELLQQEVDRQTKLLSDQKNELEQKASELAEQNKLLLKQIEELAGRRMIVSGEILSDEDSRRSSFLEDVMLAIQQHYRNPDLDVSGLSDAMGMSRSVLNDRLQESLGQSIGQFIRTYRLNVAKELIITGKAKEMNVSMLAYEVGFNDPKYFTRCFSKQFGVAPSVMMNEV